MTRAGAPLVVPAVLYSTELYVVLTSEYVVEPVKTSPTHNSHFTGDVPRTKMSTSPTRMFVLFTMPSKVALGRIERTCVLAPDAADTEPEETIFCSWLKSSSPPSEIIEVQIAFMVVDTVPEASIPNINGRFGVLIYTLEVKFA